MSFTYTLWPSGEHVRIVGTGRITTNECIELVQRVMSDPRRQSDATALIDIRDVSYDFRDKKDVVLIAKALEEFQLSLKNNIAIIAQKSTLFPAEIFCLHVRGVTNIGIRVFVDMDAAKAFCRHANGEEL